MSLVMLIGMSTTGAMGSSTRSQRSCQQRSTLSCCSNGLNYKLIMKNCFHKLLVCIEFCVLNILIGFLLYIYIQDTWIMFQHFLNHLLIVSSDIERDLEIIMCRC